MSTRWFIFWGNSQPVECFNVMWVTRFNRLTFSIRMGHCQPVESHFPSGVGWGGIQQSLRGGIQRWGVIEHSISWGSLESRIQFIAQSWSYGHYRPKDWMVARGVVRNLIFLFILCFFFVYFFFKYVRKNGSLSKNNVKEVRKNVHVVRKNVHGFEKCSFVDLEICLPGSKIFTVHNMYYYIIKLSF